MTPASTFRSSPGRAHQRGGFVIGFVVGLLIGLAIALGVALFVTKAPNPFMNKVPQRTNAQDAAEVERNRNWDPNASLAGKNPARPSSGVANPGSNTGAATSPAAPYTPPPGITLPPPIIPSATPRNPPAGSNGTARVMPNSDRVTSTLPGSREPNTPSTSASTDPFTYFVQAGAFSKAEDAEQQRAKLAINGIESRVSEREQSGRPVYRVRLGPFETKNGADAAKGRLNDAGIDSALVRVQK